MSDKITVIHNSNNSLFIYGILVDIILSIESTSEQSTRSEIKSTSKQQGSDNK